MNQLEGGKSGVASSSKVSRGKVLAILGIVGLGVMVARSKACTPVNEQVALVQPRVSEQPDEVVMGRQITAIEQNFSQLEAQLRADIAVMPAGAVRVPPNLIWQPFRLVADNRTNPYRNLPALLAHPTAPIEQVASIGWFQYNFLPPATDAGLQLGATLTVDGMRLQIPRDLDITRRRDQLLLHHELVHKGQVMNLFEQEQIGDAAQFSTYRARVTRALASMGVADVHAISEIDKEVEAYASDIELLNILMHDRLRARRGDVSSEEINAVIGEFHQRGSGSHPTLTLRDLARAYYQEDQVGDNISSHFSQFITRLYRDGLGRTPYIIRGQEVILVDDNMRVQDVRQF